MRGTTGGHHAFDPLRVLARPRRQLDSGRRAAAAGRATAGPPQPPQPMSFFVTSAGSGNGANLGGLAGADRIARRWRPRRGGGSKTWHAYLSAAAASGQPAVNARDRIGAGPWYNAKGARIAQNVADLHGDTLEQARRGNNINKMTALNEKGEPINGVGDTPNRHDMLTGSQLDGTAFTDGADHTCGTGRAAPRGHGAARPSRPHRRRQHVVELDAPEPRLQPGEPGRDRRRGAVLLLRDQLVPVRCPVWRPVSTVRDPVGRGRTSGLPVSFCAQSEHRIDRRRAPRRSEARDRSRHQERAATTTKVTGSVGVVSNR